MCGWRRPTAMTYLGHRELQATAALPPPAEVERPELTRGEYLRLLSTARVLEKERLYLLVKVFGSTGLSVGELPRLTAEALDGRGPSPVRLPPPLAEELRGYAARQGITAGPVFRSRNGQPIRRTQVTGEIRSLCRDAPGAGGKREPTLSAPAVAEDPGCHPDQCGPAGGPGLRPDDGGGTVLRGLGCRKGGGDDVTTPPSSRLRWHEYQLLRRKEMT